MFVCKVCVSACDVNLCRAVGKQTGLYPKDDVGACLVDSIIDEENDLFAGLSVSRYTGNVVILCFNHSINLITSNIRIRAARFGFKILDENPELVPIVRESLNNEVIPRHLNCLETIMSRSETGWIANTEGPSIADFILVPRLIWLEGGNNTGISTEILHSFPLLKGLIAKLMALPAVVAYYSKA